MDVGVVLELPAPGVEDPGDPREIGADAPRVVGQPFAGRGRGVTQGLVGGALMGADEGTQGFRDREGHQEVRPGQLFVEVVLKPLLRCMLLTLGTGAVATGMVDTVLSPTAGARREA